MNKVWTDEAWEDYMYWYKLILPLPLDFSILYHTTKRKSTTLQTQFKEKMSPTVYIGSTPAEKQQRHNSHFGVNCAVNLLISIMRYAAI